MLGQHKFRLNTVFQDEKTYMILYLRKKERINESLLQSIKQKNYSEFLNAMWTKSGGFNKLTYEISNLVSLSEYIKAEMPQEKYFDIISQIQKIYEKCCKSSMPANNLICDLKYTYYHPMKKKLYMAYAPVINGKYTSNIVKFLYSLNRKASVIVSDSNIMNKYNEFLETHLFRQKKNKDKNLAFSYNDLYNFLHDYEIKKEPVASAANISLAEPTVIPHDNYFMPAQKSEKKSTGTIKVSQPDRTPKPLQKPENTSVPYIQSSDGAVYCIDHVPFSIGRHSSSDLILNNLNISSYHASIILENGSYFLKDKNSTNGVFINGKKIKCEKLNDNNVFKIYDIPFTFHKDHDLLSADTGILPAQTCEAKSHEFHDGYEAYIQNVSSTEKFYIISYPCTHRDLPGIEIAKHENQVMIRNISCHSLKIETETINEGSEFSLYSGCSFCIGTEKYVFYIS